MNKRRTNIRKTNSVEGGFFTPNTKMEFGQLDLNLETDGLKNIYKKNTKQIVDDDAENTISTEKTSEQNANLKILKEKRLKLTMISLLIIFILALGFYFTMIYCPKCQKEINIAFSGKTIFRIGNEIHTIQNFIFKENENDYYEEEVDTSEVSLISAHKINSTRILQVDDGINQNFTNDEQIEEKNCLINFIDLLNTTVIVCDDETYPRFEVGSLNITKIHDTCKKNNCSEKTLRLLQESMKDLNQINETDLYLSEQVAEENKDNYLNITLTATEMIILESNLISDQKLVEKKISSKSLENMKLRILYDEFYLRNLFFNKIGNFFKGVGKAFSKIISKTHQAIKNLISEVNKKVIQPTLVKSVKVIQKAGPLIGATTGFVMGGLVSGPAGAVAGAKIGLKIGAAAQSVLNACPPQVSNGKKITGIRCEKDKVIKEIGLTGVSAAVSNSKIGSLVGQKIDGKLQNFAGKTFGKGRYLGMNVDDNSTTYFNISNLKTDVYGVITIENNEENK